MKLTRKVVREVLTTGIMLCGVFAFRSSVAEPYVVPTGSMKPTILPGDRLFVSKMAYDLKLPFTDLSLLKVGSPERGDVIVFKYPVDPSVNFVKRLMGLPGDEIEVRDGFVSINSESLPITAEDRRSILELAAEDSANAVYRESIGKHVHVVQRLSRETLGLVQKFQVPADCYFFMGDNRDNSNDSRVWGFVPQSHIRGKAVAVWFSLDSSRSTIPEVRWSRMGELL